MIALIKDNLDAINAICREYSVLRLELFGSAAIGEFDPERSEIDFVVEYPDDYDFGPWIGRYTDLLADLSKLLGYPVNLVMAGARYLENPYQAKWFNETRQLLYPADSGAMQSVSSDIANS